MEKTGFLTFKSLFKYLDATPNSRNINEGQAILNANHIITCGITEKKEDCIKMFALCLQTTALLRKPHEIWEIFMMNSNEVIIEKFICSCKAGKSGQCKHIADVLLLCARNKIIELPLLSSTDVSCYWTKNTMKKSYSPKPLLEQTCLAPKVLPPLKILRTTQNKNILDLFVSSVTESAVAKHRCGRREVDKSYWNLKHPEYQDKILTNCLNLNLLDQLPAPHFKNDCCESFYNKLKNVDVANVPTLTMADKNLLNKERQFRITGSRCYSIYTFSLDEWENKALKYFWPKSFRSKYTEYGIKHESAARTSYAKSNGYTVVETGLIISQKQPWLAYIPDGIVLINNKPTKLLEIKCPYIGKDTAAVYFINNCDYLTFHNNLVTLKKNHSYYAQIQLGMAILNLSECDFVLYSSHSKDFVNIIVLYDEEYTRKLLKKLHYNYFVNMLHVICKNKT